MGASRQFNKVVTTMACYKHQDNSQVLAGQDLKEQVPLKALPPQLPNYHASEELCVQGRILFKGPGH